jgi:hypothetical protein
VPVHRDTVRRRTGLALQANRHHSSAKTKRAGQQHFWIASQPG